MPKELERKLIPCKCGCGEDIWSTDERGRPRFYKKGHQFKGLKQSVGRRQKTSNFMKKKIGKFNHNWQGGLQKGKYIKWWIAPNQYILEHRLVMEVYLCRPLLEDEVVHHIDGNKHNNILSNLYLCSKSDHRKLHHQMDQVVYKLMNLGLVEFIDGEYRCLRS